MIRPLRCDGPLYMLCFVKCYLIKRGDSIHHLYLKKKKLNLHQVRNVERGGIELGWLTVLLQFLKIYINLLIFESLQLMLVTMTLSFSVVILVCYQNNPNANYFSH